MDHGVVGVGILDLSLARELMAEVGPLLKRLIGQYWKNKQGVPRYAHQESLRFLKKRFVEAGRALTPDLRAEHLLKSDKVGSRYQLLDLKRDKLVMGFSVEHGENSTHVLNAVSPTFTSTFRFCRLVLDESGVT